MTAIILLLSNVRDISSWSVRTWYYLIKLQMHLLTILTSLKMCLHKTVWISLNLLKQYLSAYIHWRWVQLKITRNTYSQTHIDRFPTYVSPFTIHYYHIYKCCLAEESERHWILLSSMFIHIEMCMYSMPLVLQHNNIQGQWKWFALTEFENWPFCHVSASFLLNHPYLCYVYWHVFYIS